VRLAGSGKKELRPLFFISFLHLAGGDVQKVKELAGENLELKLRLGLLVRLLISKGLITAQEYAELVAEARPRT